MNAVRPVARHLLLLDLRELAIEVHELNLIVDILDHAVIHEVILEPVALLHEAPNHVAIEAVEVPTKVALGGRKQPRIMAARSMAPRVVRVDELQDVADETLLDDVSRHLDLRLAVHGQTVCLALALDTAEDLHRLLHDGRDHVPQSCGLREVPEEARNDILVLARHGRVGGAAATADKGSDPCAGTDAPFQVVLRQPAVLL
mmetsp:Transcript_42560/g.96104  ORF Transcript_42560/g.96104 Transcript_42560/m.96104 type:complete len:202 (-) Transcript_42560:230-835(-)